MRFLIPILSLLAVSFSNCSNAQNTELKGLENIQQIAKISLNKSDYDKLVVFMKDTLAKNKNIDEGEYFICDDFMNFVDTSEILIYRYVDWKQEMTAIEYHVEQALIKNFQDSTTYESVRDSVLEANIDNDDFFSEHETFGRYLIEKNYLLVNIDINCDCYIPVVIRPKDAVKLRRAVLALGFEYEKYDVVW